MGERLRLLPGISGQRVVLQRLLQLGQRLFGLGLGFTGLAHLLGDGLGVVDGAAETVDGVAVWNLLVCQLLLQPMQNAPKALYICLVITFLY